MPELPEVETTRAGVAPHILGKRIREVIVRNAALRWPVSTNIARQLKTAKIHDVRRRAKYLLIDTDAGTLIVHLGMSGSLRVVDARQQPETHDHIDIVLTNGQAMRYRDPRRFGSFHLTKEPQKHKLLAKLGPEPWDPVFTGDWLHARSRGRSQNVKSFLMDSHNVVGVGNIYASESLHAAGIHPQRAAGRISRTRYQALTEAVRNILEAAIEAGGTTLRDFVDVSGNPGYFRLTLNAYDREGEACIRCGRSIRRIVQTGRASYFCPGCQR